MPLFAWPASAPCHPLGTREAQADLPGPAAEPATWSHPEGSPWPKSSTEQQQQTAADTYGLNHVLLDTAVHLSDQKIPGLTMQQ